MFERLSERGVAAHKALEPQLLDEESREPDTVGIRFRGEPPQVRRETSVSGERRDGASRVIREDRAREFGPKDLERSKRVLGVEENNIFEGDCTARATELGRRWGLPAGWWVGTAPIAAPPGSVEVLATDEHGHAAAWVKRFGGPEGTGFVRFWGRGRPLPDPRVALALAEYGLR